MYMTNEQKVRKAVRKEIKKTIKEDNIAVDLISWLTKKMGVSVEKRAMKKLAKDKDLQKFISNLTDYSDSPAMQRLKKS